jgi:NADH:ubiquinone oxidoreductase subunit H
VVDHRFCGCFRRSCGNDLVVTLARAALNIVLVGGIVVVLVRMVLAERRGAAAAKQRLGGWGRSLFAT